ncbi:MAG: hypothetical protein AAB851_01730 [Patescibacteria group bacterium]
MDTITIPKKELKIAVKESVKEVLDQELMKLRALLLPFASQKEQKDIEKRYSKPIRQTSKSVEIKI